MKRLREFDTSKPHYGRITDWETRGEKPFYIWGQFLGHPDIPSGIRTNTSEVKGWFKNPDGDIEIETRNSRYTLDMKTYRGKRKFKGREEAPKPNNADDVLAHQNGETPLPKNWKPAPPPTDWLGGVEFTLTPGFTLKDVSEILGFKPLSPEEKLLRDILEGDGKVSGNFELAPDAQKLYSAAAAAVKGHYGKVASMETKESLESMLNRRSDRLMRAFSTMVFFSHGCSVVRGWHDKPREDGTMIALMHSELSEALEGIRKNAMDDHIPERKSVEVELADLLHRVFDFVGKHDLDIGGAYIEKGLYNLAREDHSKEARGKAGGKAF